MPTTHPPPILYQFLGGEVPPVGLRVKVPERNSWALAWSFASSSIQQTGPPHSERAENSSGVLGSPFWVRVPD